ncbi:tyrosine-type recombinase/integrase [Bacillus atrophaeus]|uniref:site-specific integrase n=1 Tax=Bacillus atrophaeus TaxID=1452 RepID=UPI00227F57AE|nr:tyrosine-type recombinase/integrase [Bacillus atrophaeus]MCY7947012.1 tyrosine-type recombinase/integrase [Bacillus atrophaeus]MCY8097998.1 tyrosine-type recombinase/integrase [Bacillus atrophaeus]MCY9170076.1 tyrosine-type recombinase/integrase [Bacillus atrophaeus]MEC0740630.1 tyrosine-type recombinase/integrase [Bacillus atrophaeus]MEC0746934.1 tyrosine-type recombinase/integrase [Bacillus atrophaeus]
MAEKKRVYKRYFTKEKLARVNQDSVKAYEKYLRSNIIKNKDVKETTYKVYKNYFNQFLVYLSEEWENIFIHDEDYMENAVDIMEGYISFLQDTLGNNKKVINTKLSAVSSYYLWAMKRGIIEKHPFDRKLDRMRQANDERLISHYFLTDEQVEKVTRVIHEDYKKTKGRKYDIQDLLIWHIAIESGNRNGAISKLVWSKLDLENMLFEDIREKRGKMKEVTFEEGTRDLLIEWREMRKKMDNLECDAIFIAKKNGVYNRMSQTSIYMRVRKMGKILGLDDLHPHCLRKTAIDKVAKDLGLSEAQEFAGHEDVSTTQKHYVKPKSKTEIREKLKKMREKKAKASEEKENDKDSD